MSTDSKSILITGAAGFIGFHLAVKLLKLGHRVHGYDALTDYYDVNLKKQRLKILGEFENFTMTIAKLENFEVLKLCTVKAKPHFIIHLAAQAGVRYSIENPRAYIDANIFGSFNILEVSKQVMPNHLMMASTSSVYGANTKMPFTESQKTNTPLTLYAATKKANEEIAHSYSNIYNIPITMCRFFTVYGPWGRPDLALFKFVKAILQDQKIDIYNYGKMYRDFTYIDDLTHSLSLLMHQIPNLAIDNSFNKVDTISPVAPFRVVNIGNSTKVKLMDFIEAIELELGVVAKKNFMDLQIGDVPATFADTTLLKSLIGYVPSTHYNDGIREFVKWYREYYGK